MKLAKQLNKFVRHLLRIIIAFVFLSSCSSANAQSFSAYGVQLYDYYGHYFSQEIPIVVSGLPGKCDTTFGIESAELTIHHSRVSDLKISLQSPNGNTVWLTNRNGGTDGENYLRTKFSLHGRDGLINTATAPFTGEFTPDGQLTYLNDGSNPNGTWKLIVEDLKEGELGYLDSVSITFGNHPAFIRQKHFCSLANPGLCVCQGNKPNGNLLPDLVIVPYFSKNQIQEFAWNDPYFPGQLKISVAIANIGYGPLEVLADTSVKGSCCDGHEKPDSAPRFPLLQKIYSKEGNKITYSTIKTGTIYFESKPGHHHYHVDHWVEFRLYKMINGKKQLVTTGNKVSYCLFTTGTLYEKDSSSIINGKKYGGNMPNYALGDYGNCDLQKQGISVGGYDYYGMMYEGQYLQLPKALKSGEYILEIEVDPDHKYMESNKSNNVLSIEIKIEKQG